MGKILLVVPALFCIGLTLVFFPSQCGSRLKGRIVNRLASVDGGFGFIVEEAGEQFLAIGEPLVYYPYNGAPLGCYPYATAAVAALIEVHEPIIVRYDADDAIDRIWRVRDGAVLWER